MAGVDVNTNPSLPLIEQLISLVTMFQFQTETNDEYLGRFNYELKNWYHQGENKSDEVWKLRIK